MSTEDDSPTESRLPLPHLRRGAGGAPRYSLLVMSEAGVFAYALPASGEVTIGRGDTCDVRITDAKASRRHATLRIGDAVAIVDDASTNGTKVGERALQAGVPTPLVASDMIAIGSTILTLKSVRVTRPPARVYSEAAFREPIEEERARARAGGPGFALVQLKIEPRARLTHETTRSDELSQDVALVEQIEASLAEVLRASDVVGSFAPATYTLLLPETAPDVAAKIATQLRTELRTRKVTAAVGLACHPRDGATLESLVQVAADDAAEPSLRPASQLDQGAMTRLAPIIDRIAAGRINVLILGETGVGKEVMARTLHVRSSRALGPLVCVNCAALSESLLESELFGHEKGAFTGAVQAKAGLLESANGGTVFLDEIGEMPLSLQAKILRVLEQREVLRVGSLRPRAIDVRFLSATNRDLEAEIRQGRFREDLFYRLNGISVTIPPLRERVEEIEGLANVFAQQAAEAAQREPPVITRPVLALLKRYSWPGNIRELRNVMERAVVLSSGTSITLEHMPAGLMGPVVSLSQARIPRRAVRAPHVTMPPDVEGGRAEREASTKTFDPETTTASSEAIFRPGMSERERVMAALEACQGNQTHAARLLGMARRTLIMRIEEYGLPRPRKK